MCQPDGPELDRLAAAVARRLQLPGGPIPIPVPAGDPDPSRPQLPWDPLDEGPVPLLPRRRLRIAGVELTQSIQHNGAAGESFGADNSVPLVALKTMVARVYPYVSPGLAMPDGLSGAHVTGELVLSIGHTVVHRTGPTRVDGARVGPLGELSRTLWDTELTFAAPAPGGLAVELRRLNPPLNFVVPAHLCRRGRMHVSVRIWRVGGGSAAVTSDTATHSRYVQFLDVPAPRVALVRVNWVDGSGTVTRPSDADMLTTMRLARRMLPFPYFETSILAVEETSSAAFATPATGGGCNQAWQDLNTTLAVTRIFTTLFGLGDIIFGMVPRAAIPAAGGPINSGCGIESGGCFVGEEPTFAHELGHLYQRSHVAVPGDATSDPNYPNYGGDPRSIGEVGVDTGTSPPTVFDPVTSDDIMSYGNNQWISPYTYRGILDGRGLHQSAPADPRRVRPVVVAVVRLHRTPRGLTGVEMRTTFRLDAAGTVPARPDRAPSPISVDVLDRDGRILATHHCRYVPPVAHGTCGCGHPTVPLEREPYLDLFEVIEWPREGAAALSFHTGGEPLARVDVGEPPTVRIEGPERRGPHLVVRVQAEHPRVRPAVAVLFSADDGDTWQPVGFDPPDGELAVEAGRLPGGARCRFRAVAGAELTSAVADTEPFEREAGPRALHVVAPVGGCVAPGHVALGVWVDTRGNAPLPPGEIRWTSDLQGDLGQGYDILPDLVEGEHRVVVTAPDGVGGTISERAIIIVGGRSV